ncbi:MAG TPA: phosphatase PAP2 family protein [Tepidisphaeraceae bacterium]|jgi:acid phosphatase (class A)|nr:phosphatase PAP2 family protein [Tepidisphaeraceae bacterium]
MTKSVAVMLAICAFVVAAKAVGPFVQPDDIDIKSILSPPPAQDSDQTRAEIERLLQLQAKRTDADVKRIRSEVKFTPFIFSDVLGSWFNPDDLPTTAGFLKEVMKNAASVEGHAKVIFGRHRPFVVDSRIHPCVEKEKTYSYPSGHATRSMVLALTLAQMFPDHKDALIAQAKQIGDDRVLAGQHFPSDVEAGRTLAKAIFQQMTKNPDFQAELQKARDECLAKDTAK